MVDNEEIDECEDNKYDDNHGEKKIFTASRLPSGENATASKASPRL